jgi:hypothetical protein
MDDRNLLKVLIVRNNMYMRKWILASFSLFSSYAVASFPGFFATFLIKWEFLIQMLSSLFAGFAT